MTLTAAAPQDHLKGHLRHVSRVAQAQAQAACHLLQTARCRLQAPMQQLLRWDRRAAQLRSQGLEQKLVLRGLLRHLRRVSWFRLAAAARPACGCRSTS